MTSQNSLVRDLYDSRLTESVTLSLNVFMLIAIRFMMFSIEMASLVLICQF